MRFFPVVTAATSARSRIKRAFFFLLFIARIIQPSPAQSNAKSPQVPNHLRAARAAMLAHDAASAGREFRAVLALEPRNLEARVNLGVLEMVQGDCREASHDFKQALAIQSSLLKAKALLGICSRRLGDSGAKAMLEYSFPRLADPILQTQVGMELVGIYYQEGNPEHATTVVQKLVDLNPDNVDILYMAQRLYGELAEGTLNKLAILAPDSARMQQVIAERLVNGGDLKGASEHYRKALKIDPRLPGVRYELAEAVLETTPNDPPTQAEAEKDFQTAIASEGDSSKVQCELGRIATLRSDTDSAYQHFTRAFQLNPQDSSAQLGLGRTLMTMEKPQEARKYLEMAVQSDPLNNEAHYRLALDYKRLQLTEQAAKEMHLFQEIKKTKDQVKQLYRQMNRQPKAEPEEDAATEQ